MLLHDDLHWNLLIYILQPLLEVFDKLSNLVNQILLACTECLLDILNSINLFLVCLQEAMISFFKICQRRGLLSSSIYLRLLETILEIQKLLSVALEDFLYFIPLFCKSCRSGQNSQLFLLHLKDDLIDDLLELILKVNLVICSLLWLVGHRRQLLRKE